LTFDYEIILVTIKPRANEKEVNQMRERRSKNKGKELPGIFVRKRYNLAENISQAVNFLTAKLLKCPVETYTVKKLIVNILFFYLMMMMF
jgi:hypothetical protein